MIPQKIDAKQAKAALEHIEKNNIRVPSFIKRTLEKVIKEENKNEELK